MSLRPWFPAFIVVMAAVAAAAPVNLSPVTIDGTFSGALPLEVQVRDLDGDARLDLVVSLIDVAGDADSLFWYQNDGGTGFVPMLIDGTLGAGGENPEFVVFGDFALDSLPEVITATSNRMFMYENSGGGAFTRNQIDGGLGACRDGRVVDVDGDADPDIVFTTNGGIYWEENEGLAGFTRRPIHLVPVVDDGIDAADLDRDGDADIVAGVYNVPPDHWLSWYERTMGSYAMHVFDVLEESVTDLRVADLDRDGRLDVVVCKDNNEVVWYEQAPGLLFLPTTIDNLFNQTPRRLAVFDIDNDTDLDVLVVGGNSAIGEVVYYENDGTGGFTRRPVDATAGNRWGVAVGRVRPGLLPDVFVGQQFPHALICYRNLGLGTGVGETPGAGFRLLGGYPNPFSTQTTIEFELPSAARVDVDVFGVDGSRVRRVASRELSSGVQRVLWDGRDDAGKPVGSGVYFLRVSGNGAHRSTKMILQR